MSTLTFISVWKQFQYVSFSILVGLIVCLSAFDATVAQNKPAIEAGDGFAHAITAQTKSERGTFSVQISNNTIQEALEILASKVKVGFSYTPEIIPDKKVQLEMNNVKVHEILYKLLEGTNLEPVLPLTKDVIVIREKELLPAVDAFQQTVTGTVVDADGESLPGVTILVKNTNTGTSTDFNGTFELTVSSISDTLVFSSIGYQSKEVPIEGRTDLNVTLEQIIVAGSELVVVGYGAQEKRDITGSVGSVSAEQINQVASTSAVQAMQGRVSGVNISQNGYNPGENATVRIRGTRSITATNDPLYVIDGIPMANGSVTMNDINPADIESIEILKDASATAIYGSRGANGVILISTRRAETGRVTVKYNAYQGYQTPLNDNDVFTPGEYVEYLRDSYRNSSTGTYNSPVPSMEEDRTISQIAQDPYTLESVLMGYEQGNWNPDRVRGFDWYDAVTRTGILQNHHMSISRGSENSSILIAGGYYGNEGIQKTMDYKRYTLRANIDYDVSERIGISGSMLLSRVDENIGPDLYAGSRSRMPVSRPRNDDGEWIYYIGNDPLMTNPLMDIDGIVNESRQNRVLSNITVSVNLLEGLDYEGRFGYDYRTGRDGNFQASDSRARLGDDPAASYGGNSGTDLLAENLLRYSTSFGNIHDLQVTLLNSYQENTFESYGVSVENLPYEAQQFYNVGSASDILGVNSNLSEWQILSFMGRINYQLLDRYLFTVTGRNDGSSRLAEGNKNYFFPSAAFGWRISDEAFLSESNFINDLKLRISYGETGNSAVDPYQTQGSLQLRRYLWGDDNVIIGFAPGTIPNPSLRWENTAQVNLGLDYAVLNSRISGSVEVYRSTTTDLLMPRVIPIVSGFEAILDNVGQTRNTGFEASLSTVNTPYESAFNWETNFIFSTNKEEILELVQGKIDDIGNQWFIGQPIDVFYDREAIGIWQDTPEDLAEIAKFNANGHNYEPGLVRVKDQNGDYLINSEDRVILGTPRPKWTASVTSNMYYKNFDLSFQIYASYGNMGYYNQNLQLNGRYNMVAIDYWTPENPTNRYPKPNFDWLAPPDINLTYYEDASYARLKYVTLGYALPASVVNKLGGTNFRVYVSAQNPYIYTNFSGPDPEGAQGIQTPSPKTFMVGVDLTF